ncbi:MAG: Flp family type IVb pilin [Anaerolineales bacterium]
MELHRLESGQGLAEYGIIILLVGIAVVAALTLLGPAVGNLYSSVVSGFPGY